MPTLPSIVYLLCFVTSVICMLLLLRGYRQSGARLLLWSALCFVALAANNFFLFLDVVVLPDANLLPLRHAASLAAVGVLLYGFIWETD
ncbi:MAG TPA: DUF5985 family protein [Alphaproteobacteria bacterium]|nr:DUF5985 family protein [Alphaproteobacteria bacterium]